jgi:ribosomal protein S18 acetylase RimI-like enzyme
LREFINRKKQPGLKPGEKMIEIRRLEKFDADELNRVTGPYTCSETYRVRWEDSEGGTVFSLERVPLETPFVGRYEHIDAAWIEAYLRPSDFAFGAYAGSQLVGMLIAESRAWNSSLWVHEFHVMAERRGQGIGRQLMEHAAVEARKAGLRVIVCETQNQNASAIQAYRRLGFRPEGIDISYYTNQDYPGRGIAVFMKRRILP